MQADNDHLQARNQAQTQRASDRAHADSMQQIGLGKLANHQMAGPVMQSDPKFEELSGVSFSNVSRGISKYYQIDDPLLKWGAAGDNTYGGMVSGMFKLVESPDESFVDGMYRWMIRDLLLPLVDAYDRYQQKRLH